MYSWPFTFGAPSRQARHICKSLKLERYNLKSKAQRCKMHEPGKVEKARLRGSLDETGEEAT